MYATSVLSRYDGRSYFSKYAFLSSNRHFDAHARLLSPKLFKLPGLLFIVVPRIIPSYPQTQVNVRRHATNGELLWRFVNAEDRASLESAA